ncbi:MAG: SusC/RagA family TonB-linked outer membrane protein [Bacteroidales bacterium]
MKRIALFFSLLAFASVTLFAQPVTITGTVSSAEDGTTFPGVTIVVKGTTIGTITDFDGNYRIQVPQNATTLVFSYVGMQSVEVPIEGRTEIDIALEAEIVGLDEVVVVGYGEQSRRLLTGSVGKMESEAIEDSPYTGIDQAMQGRIAGVMVNSNSGTPGGAATVRIRGSSSILASNSPLYIVDGIPIITGDYSLQSANFGGQDLNALVDINPSDIESIEILKDASYASIYGARAANGVVLITTKSGKKGKVKVNFNSYYGIQQISRKINLTNAKDYATLMNEAIENTFSIPDYFGDPADQEYDTDWQDEVTRVPTEAFVQEYQLSFDGGDDKIKYFISGNYHDKNGLIIGSAFKRYSGRINLDVKGSDRLTLGTRLYFASTEHDRIYSDNNIYGPWSNAIANPPNEPVYEEGTEEYFDTYYPNPVAMGLEPKHKFNSYRNLINFFAEYDILKNLTFKSSLNADILNTREDSFLPTDIGLAAGSNGSALSGNSNVYKIVFDNTLNYRQTFAEKHGVSLLGGFSYERYNDYYTSVSGIQLPGNEYQYVTSAAEIVGGTSFPEEYKLSGFFGRFNYDYNKKYLLNATFRADGSSRFGAENRYAYFPSVSAAWRMSEESFMQTITFLSDLKLRAAYGTTGNQEIGNYSSLGIWSTGINYLNLAGLAPTQLANPDLRWEKTSTIEGGVDAGFFNDRVFFSVNYYSKITSDLLLPRRIPATSGFTIINENIGEISNKGFEFSLGGQVFADPKGLNWDLNLNMATNQSKVEELYNDEPINIGYANRFEVGEPFAAFYGYRYIEVDPQDGSIVYKDKTGDGITDDDREIIGNPNPLLTGGITSTFSYKGIELSGFLQFNYGNDIMNAFRTYSESYYSDNLTSRMMDRWQRPGQVTDIPKPSYADPDYQLISSRFLEDGSYLRLQSLTLAYNIPSNLLEPLKINKLRLYFSGQNIWLSTKYSGVDPEVNYAGSSNTVMGTDFYTYPIPRVWTLGIDLGF